MNTQIDPHDPEFIRRRKWRNWALASALAGFVVFVYILAMVKMKGG